MKYISLLSLSFVLGSMAAGQSTVDFENPQAPCDDSPFNPIRVSLHTSTAAVFPTANTAVIYSLLSEKPGSCTLLAPLGGDQAVVMNHALGTCAPLQMDVTGMTSQLDVPYAIDIPGSVGDSVMFDALRNGVVVDRIVVPASVTGGWVLGAVSLQDPQGIDQLLISSTAICQDNPLRLYVDEIEVGGLGWRFDSAPTACAPTVNFAGLAGQLALQGQGAVTPDVFEFEVSDLVPNTFGVFLGSSTGAGGLLAGTGMGVGCGQLCIINPSRWSNVIDAGGSAVVPFSSDSNGFAVNQLVQGPSTGLVGPAGLLTMMAGETWSFQYWYRDFGSGQTGVCNTGNPIPNFNFTNAVQLTWQ